jgi:hypothetical protein
MRSIPPYRIFFPIVPLTVAFLSVGFFCGCQTPSTDPNPLVVPPMDTTQAGSKDSANADPNDKASLSLLSPKAGEAYKLGDSLHITAEIKGNGKGTINAIDYSLSPDGGRTWGALSDLSLAVDARSSLDFSWKIPTFFTANGKTFSLAENDGCMIRIAQHNTSDSQKISFSGRFMIEDTVFIRLTYPLGGESFKVGDTLPITWTVKDDPANPVDAVDVMASPDSGKTWAYLRPGSILPESPSWERVPWIVPESLSVFGNKTGLVGNPGVCIRVEQYSTPDPKHRFRSGMISISRP